MAGLEDVQVGIRRSFCRIGWRCSAKQQSTEREVSKSIETKTPTKFIFKLEVVAIQSDVSSASSCSGEISDASPNGQAPLGHRIFTSKLEGHEIIRQQLTPNSFIKINLPLI